MEFGIKPTQSGHDFQAALTQSVQAEEYGFSTVYLSQHHGFSRAGYWPAPIVGLAGIATRTSSIKLGTSIVQLPLENPVHVAGRLTLLDTISNGRVIAGFGLGWRSKEYESFGVEMATRGRRMTEYLRLLDELLRGGETSFEGEFYELSDFTLAPDPVQSPRPELLVGGKSDNAIRRAIEIGDSWNPPAADLEEMEKFCRKYRSRSDKKLVLGTDGTVVRDDARAAQKDGKRYILSHRKPVFTESDTPYPGVYTDFEDFTSTIENDFEAYRAQRPFLVGTPDECIEQIDRIHERTGFDELLLRVSTPEFTAEEVDETIELLGTEVLPSF